MVDRKTVMMLADRLEREGQNKDLRLSPELLLAADVLRSLQNTIDTLVNQKESDDDKR